MLKNNFLLEKRDSEILHDFNKKDFLIKVAKHYD